MHIYPHLSVGGHLSSLGDQLSYSPITIHEPAKDLALKWFQSQPCIGKRILCFFFEPVDGNTLSFVLTGNTWNFRDDLERAGISGARNENNGYYRFLKDIDITDPDGRQRILSLVDILRKQACRCVVDPEPEAESPVANFLEELRSMDCLHFDA